MTQPKVLVASTAAGHCCDGLTEYRWLTHLDAWLERGYDFFFAAQVGQGHDSKLSFLIGDLREANFDLGDDDRCTIWKYSLDMGEPSVSTGSRLPGICAGRNLAHEFAQGQDYTHLCFIDTDIMPSEDGIERLLEVNWPLVGAHVPGYCHNGPRLLVREDDTGTEVYSLEETWTHPYTRVKVTWPEQRGIAWYATGQHPFPIDADVRTHWTTAGALMMNRDCFRAVRWRIDAEAGLSDDPATIETATRLGYGPEWVRHDVVWDHEILVPLEDRGRDLTIRR